MIDTLNEMSLETLSQYVRAETASLQGAKSDLDDKRTKGVHRAYARTEQFMVEFDRFLTVYSGVVNILSSADAQYGGVATAMLALLFAVRLLQAAERTRPPRHTNHRRIAGCRHAPRR